MPLIGGYPEYVKPKKKKNVNTAISRETFISRYMMAMDNKYKYVAVIIKDERNPKPEIIINMQESMENKFKYYLDAYDEDLRLKNCQHIRIIGVSFFDEFSPAMISPTLLR